MLRTVSTRAMAFVLAITVLSVVAGCSTPSAGSAAKGATDGARTASSSASADTSPVPAAGGGLHTSAYKVTGKERVKVVTNRGTFTIELFPKDAPNTVATFLELAKKKFYDGIKFHRVEPGFVVQAGDPQTKDPAADPASYGTGDPGFKLKAEFNDRKHLTGTVAMARAEDPDSAGSQFYITLAPQPSLDGQYTVFGQVVSGMDVVNAIKVGDTITSMTIVPAP